MKRTKLILNHFYSTDDLKHGIEVLQHYQVPILEVHLSKPIKGIDEKLQIKRLRRGHAAIKFGLLGGTALSTLTYYLIEHGWPLMNSKTISAFLIGIIIMALTFVFATYLFPSRVPKVISLPPSDSRFFLIVVDANHITAHEEIGRLFQYAEAVEMSPPVKDIVTA
ncbi:quinol:electron acceptor oxidoreductase subunit ActD [Mucilaginibacter angelicae]|uniref:Quinol:electron acceptor oxidoreductase subunit ActD n=1 Tax=Mucilaginibacter angelicae TaxID=869718 RepID=A0ABV6L7C4_9SPHI